MRIIFIVFLFILSSCSTTSQLSRYPSSIHAGNCTELVTSFDRIPIESGPIVVGRKSFSRYLPNFESFNQELNTVKPHATDYIASYKEVFNGKNPTLSELIDFLISAHQQLAKSIRDQIGKNNDLDIYLEDTAKAIEISDSKMEYYMNLETSIDERAAMKMTYSQDNEEQRKILQKFGGTNYIGHIGELDVLLKLDNVHAQGMYLSEKIFTQKKAQEINDLLSKTLKEKLDTISEDMIPQLSQEFPHVFKATSDYNNEEILKRAIIFLKSKEFDIIAQNGNQFAIVEVKNYGQPIDLKMITPSENGKKTILDQQLETIDIFKFLELDREFFPTVAFINGVTPEAKKIFESHGISVLADVIQQ